MSKKYTPSPLINSGIFEETHLTYSNNNSCVEAASPCISVAALCHVGIGFAVKENTFRLQNTTELGWPARDQ